jgi:outer membrane lipoprotein-sorting protein
MFFVTVILSAAALGFQATEVDKVLERLERRFDGTDAFSYEFIQKKAVIQLAEPLHFKGVLTFRKPHYIRLELRGDENLNLYVNGEKIWLEDLDYGEVETFDFGMMASEKRLSRLLPPTLQQSVKELKDVYDIALTKKDGNISYLDMTPKTPDAYGVKTFQFSVDQHSRLRWMKVSYENGDLTETTFSEWKKLPQMSIHLFEYHPPRPE